MRELDVSHWMPSFVEIKKCDVEEHKDEQEVISIDENTYELGSEDSDESSDDDVRSLLPDEIIVSSGESDVKNLC